MKTLELTVARGNKIISTLKKYYNGKWNANTNSWTVNVKEKDEKVFFANFSEYITKKEIVKEEMKETKTNNYHEVYDAKGFDFAEEGIW